MDSTRLQRRIRFFVVLCAFALPLVLPRPAAWAQRVIDPDCGGAGSIRAADLDGDGDLDVAAVSLGSQGVLWWENDGHLSFNRHTITSGIKSSMALCVADLDGDGDQDLIVGKGPSNPVGIDWFENRAAGQFVQHTVDTATPAAGAIVASDLDGDGDQDFAVADRGISWFRNMGGGTFEGMTLGANGYDIAGIDREGDGDIDLVSTYYSAQTWWINDGHGNFAPSEFHWSASGGTAVYAADLNGDREAEVVLSTYSGGGAVGWVERVGGAYVEHRLAPFGGARDCWAGDLDCDGDNDIVGISDSQGVHWWENRGGGQFLVHGLVTSGSFQCVTGADLDRDGDTELIVGADGISYWPNQWRSPGPAPALTSVGDAGGGALGVQWANTNDMPAQYLGIAYDIYGQQWAPIQGTGSPWQPFAPTALAGEMPLGQSGGYHLWLGSQFFFNELLLCRNPWTGILYDAAPHSPLQFLATASDIVGWPFGRQVDLKWKSDIYGTWQYQLIAYKLDKGWVQTYSLADGNSFWHLATYPDSSHLNGQVSLFLPEGNYWIYLRAIGWVPPYPASAFATAFVSVPGM